MAGHDERDGIAPIGRADHARRRWTSEMLRDLSVADELPHRDLQQGLPHLQIERRADQDQWHELAALRTVLGKNAGRQILRILQRLTEVRPRPARCHIIEGSLPIIATLIIDEREAAEAALRHQ